MRKKILFIFVLFSILFIPRIVYATGNNDKVHFIKNDNDESEAIVIESNGHFGLVDTMSPGPTSSLASYSSLVDNYDNGTKVYNYLKKLGCEYLDFIVITHNHYQNNGGISELLELVNENTIVFYKEDIEASDDIEQYNHIAYLYEMSYLDSRNAIECDLTVCNISNISNSFISNISRDNNDEFEYETELRKSIYFNFGDYRINLYNLNTISNYNENLNSIVTLVTHIPSNKKVALMADQESGRGDFDYSYSQTVTSLITNPVGECEKCNSYGLIEQSASVIGNVDVLKSSNHGANTSSSYYLFRVTRPKDYIITSTYIEEGNSIYPKPETVPQIFFIERAFSTSSYYTEQSNGAITVEFDNENYYIKDYSSDTGSVFNNSIDPIGTNLINNSGSSWISIKFTNITNDKKLYIENNSIITGWKEIDGYTYYFDIAGIMLEGREKIVSNNTNYYYYFTEQSEASQNHPYGSMRTGFVKTQDDYLFYFRTDDNDISIGPKGSAVNGFNTINSELFYFKEIDDDDIVPINSAFKGLVEIQNETYYFRTSANEFSTGSEGSVIKNACIRLENKRYCFDENGHVTSVHTYVDLVTSANCMNRQYTGSVQTLTTEALDGYTWSNNTGVDIRSYQVTATLKNGYIWDNDSFDSITITCDISKIKLTKPSLSVNEFQYNGNPITPQINYYDSTVMNKTGIDSAYLVGDYSMTISIQNTDFYEWSDNTNSSAILNWRIVKGYLAPPSLIDYNELYDGNPHSIGVEPISIGTLYYKTDDTDWSLNPPTRTNFGTTTVYAKLAGNSNYNDSGVVTGTIQIRKAPALAPSVTNYVGECDGNPHTFTVDDSTDGTIYYKLGEEDWSLTKPTATDAGETIVSVKVVGDDNHMDSEIVEAKIILVGENNYYINDYGINQNNNYIYGISADTILSDFSSHIIIGYGYELSVDTKTIDGKKLVYTGGKTRILSGTTVISEYTNIVYGDPSGDGVINSADLLRLRQHLLGISTLTEAYFLAGDVSRDSTINSADLLRMRQHLLGILPIE